MKIERTCLAALFMLGCGEVESGEAPVPVRLSVRANSQASEFQRADGWLIELDEASLLLGPIYLRAPKRQAQSSLASWLLPKAFAHGAHAQTLTEGQVIGEYLEQVAIDALHPGVLELGTIRVAASHLERISIVLDEPRDPDQAELTHGHHAWVSGRAKKGMKTVELACGLDIGGDSRETPENLEERRRVDQIAVKQSPLLDGPAHLTVMVDVRRWLELIDFDVLEEGENPCAADDAPLFGQWYLGLRRPEAFATELKKGG